MSIYVVVEGETERAAKRGLKEFLDSQRGERPRVGLEFLVVKHQLTKDSVVEACNRVLARQETLGVVALTDVHPGFSSADEAKKTVRRWMPQDPRCHAHAALWEFEAWLLCGWDEISRKLRLRTRCRYFGFACPEGVDHDNPPSKRLNELFRTATGRGYRKVHDGEALFGRLDLRQVASLCSEFKAFADTLLNCAGYPPVS